MDYSAFTDEQILAEGRKLIEDRSLRRCRQCTNSDSECSMCRQLRIPIHPYTYAGDCKHFLTNEEKLLWDSRDALARQERSERKLNHLLTCCINCIEAATMFLEDFETRMESYYRAAEMRGTGDPIRFNVKFWLNSFRHSRLDLESCCGQMPDQCRA